MTNNTAKIMYTAFLREAGQEAGEVEIDITGYEIIDDLELCEALYKATNTYAGDLWNRMQPLPENRTHTALSVGDVVVIRGTGYLCSMIGFQKILENVTPDVFMTH
jgi:hypothetical protein